MSGLSWLEYAFLAYFGLINLYYICFLILGSCKTFFRIQEVREEDTSGILSSNSLPEILFVIPMFNERETILPCIYNLLNLSYRYKQIIVVNDGSDDDTLDIVRQALDLVEIPKYYADAIPTQPVRTVFRSRTHPEITVIDKVRGRKFDAVNAAINAVPTPFFVVLDADTFVDNAGFEALVRPILTSPDTIAVGASVRILNGCTLDFNRISTASFPREFLPAMQALEYLRAFLLRQGLDTINAVFIIAGVFSIFPRDLILKAGGFCSSAGEDVEIILRLHRMMHEANIPYKIAYLPDPIAWTVAPSTVAKLRKQRMRWHLGLLESIWYHKRVFYNPRYGAFGLLGYPFWVFGEALEPIAEVSAWTYVAVTAALGILNMPFLVLLLALSFGFTALYTFFCLFLEELSFRKYPSLRSLAMLVLCNFVENVGYRQLTLWWRLCSFVQFFRNFRQIEADRRTVNALVRNGVANLRNPK